MIALGEPMKMLVLLAALVVSACNKMDSQKCSDAAQASTRASADYTGCLQKELDRPARGRNDDACSGLKMAADLAWQKRNKACLDD